jgi:hypothetical protein
VARTIEDEFPRLGGALVPDVVKAHDERVSDDPNADKAPSDSPNPSIGAARGANPAPRVAGEAGDAE